MARKRIFSRDNQICLDGSQSLNNELILISKLNTGRDKSSETEQKRNVARLGRFDEYLIISICYSMKEGKFTDIVGRRRLISFTLR